MPLALPSARSRDTVSIPAGVVCRSCSWTQWPGRNDAQRCSHGCLAIGIQDRETKPWSLAASLYPPEAGKRPQKKLQQWVSGCRAHCLQTRELGTTETCFPLATGALCTHPSVRCRYTERQQPASPAHPNPTHRSCTTGSIWGQGIALGFGTPSPTTFLHGIGPLRLRGPGHIWHPPPQETGYFPPLHRDLKSKSSARELNNLCFKVTYWRTTGRLLISVLEKCLPYINA